MFSPYQKKVIVCYIIKILLTLISLKDFHIFALYLALANLEINAESNLGIDLIIA